MTADVLRTKMLDAPCQGCGLMVSVWRTWSGVMVCDPSWTGPGGVFHGQRHCCTNALDSRARMRENGRSEEALSKRRQHCYPALAAPVEVLTHLPGPRRISE